MIVTVTANPSIDRTLRIPALLPGGLVRARSATAEAAGKGVNVARLLTQQGEAATAVLPLSRESAAVYEGLLRGATPIDVVEIRGPVRVNISLVDWDHSFMFRWYHSRNVTPTSSNWGHYKSARLDAVLNDISCGVRNLPVNLPSS